MISQRRTLLGAILWVGFLPPMMLWAWSTLPLWGLLLPPALLVTIVTLLLPGTSPLAVALDLLVASLLPLAIALLLLGLPEVWPEAPSFPEYALGVMWLLAIPLAWRSLRSGAVAEDLSSRRQLL